MQEEKRPQVQDISAETLKTLQSLERESKKQTMYLRIAATGTISTFLVVVVAIIAGVIAFYKIEAAMESALQEIENFSEQITAIDLDGMSQGIAEMVENIDGLVTESRDGINAATETMEEIDISTLNDAIEDLQDVMEPLSNFFNIF